MTYLVTIESNGRFELDIVDVPRGMKPASCLNMLMMKYDRHAAAFEAARQPVRDAGLYLEVNQ